MNTPIKIGSLVTIKDGSYMLTICPKTHKLTRYPDIDNWNGNLVFLNHIYIVVAINVPCPHSNAPCPNSTDILNSLSIPNNCIIQDLKNGLIWFCSHINLESYY